MSCIGTCTSVGKKEKLKKLGFDVHLFDAKDPELVFLFSVFGIFTLLRGWGWGWGWGWDWDVVRRGEFF
ncbi:hypothetical protein L1987_46947 [Smallanthus sonchifolius]|uniref:Uncharacterized protein n=1 Tax=Smallanthus sonchifolius TaxID=185202 RepID=A0ACB9G104_9ASTR|nr:hypothetical protein L1987_46947 [Smallanthus sonchifolius]